MAHGFSILLVNGRTLIRATLAAWLRGQGFERVEETTSLKAADECLRLSPSIVLLNAVTTDSHAAEAARTIRAKFPSMPMLALIDPANEHVLRSLLAQATENLFSTNEPPERLVTAIRGVVRGEAFRSPAIQLRATVPPELRPRKEAKPGGQYLTPREIEVLRYLAEGLTKRQIAESIHLSIKTIDNHCTSIMAKLNIHNRVELARYAIREGLSQV